MQTLLSNFVFVSLSRSLFFVQFGNRVVHFVSILLLCVFVYRPRSVCWHKMKTKEGKKKKNQTLLKLKKQMTILVVGQHIISKAGPQVMIPLHETIARSSRN